MKNRLFSDFSALELFVIRHSQCELGTNCPCVVLLEFCEKIIEEESEQTLVLTLTTTERNILEIIDEHVSSYSHFTDFDNKKNVKDLTQRTRRLIYLRSQGVNMVIH